MQYFIYLYQENLWVLNLATLEHLHTCITFDTFSTLFTPIYTNFHFFDFSKMIHLFEFKLAFENWGLHCSMKSWKQYHYTFLSMFQELKPKPNAMLPIVITSIVLQYLLILDPVIAWNNLLWWKWLMTRLESTLSSEKLV